MIITSILGLLQDQNSGVLLIVFRNHVVAENKNQDSCKQSMLHTIEGVYLHIIEALREGGREVGSERGGEREREISSTANTNIFLLQTAPESTLQPCR